MKQFPSISKGVLCVPQVSLATKNGVIYTTSNTFSSMEKYIHEFCRRSFDVQERS
jgi:hypothetical protein